ncbi:MAG: YggS family pyridoxal phosphate-dependent enzyme [Planctomycetes bacterium]|nr:YggS family pyridoxal phosphate-dependent enzyme [Planctomycetota bacterium]
MSSTRDKLRENLTQVRQRIARAAVASGRTAEAVRLVAVTKQVGTDVAAELVEMGVSEIGESRPQELWRKAETLNRPVRWHLVGPLQRNKARRTLPLVGLIHSIDSLSLLRWLDELAEELGLQPAVLLEVNVSGETSKHGFRPDEARTAVEAAGQLNRLRVCGLMTMAPYDPDPEHARPTFAGLRELRDRLQSVASPNCQLTELSMGMSGDFEVAITEGATLVRVGSALFHGIEPPA